MVGKANRSLVWERGWFTLSGSRGQPGLVTGRLFPQHVLSPWDLSLPPASPPQKGLENHLLDCVHFPSLGTELWQTHYSNAHRLLRPSGLERVPHVVPAPLQASLRSLCLEFFPRSRWLPPSLQVVAQTSPLQEVYPEQPASVSPPQPISECSLL